MESTTEKSKKTRGLEPKATRASETKTEKIKVTVNTAEAKELEISFPYYVKDDAYYCKFLRRDRGVMIADYSFSKTINYGYVPENWLIYESISEEEFNEKFNEVMNNLINIKTNGDEKTI